MPKPSFNPVQYELRNQIPTFVSEEQAAQITTVTDRVNQQLGWVAQALGWNGANYWDTLTTTVHQKRALLGGTFGVYNAYTLLALKQIRTWENRVWVEKKPNVSVGQRVIIGDQQTYIYGLEEEDADTLSLNLGELSQTIIGYLQQGAAIKVDAKENRPFPFYRPTAEASADAYFRCSVGATTRETDFYRYTELVLSPFDQNNVLIPYTNLCLFGGSYYYFDRAVYLTQGTANLVPWVEAQWIESQGLWEVYVPETIIGNSVQIVWNYAIENTSKAVFSSVQAQVIAWEDPSDWGNAGEFFNPVLDEYRISKTYNIAGLNYSLGTRLFLGDNPPTNDNPLWYDAGSNKLYTFTAGSWVAVGVGSELRVLDSQSSPPPATYDFQPGSIWQSPEGRIFIWDAGFVSYDFFYFFPNGLINGFFYIDPSYQNVQGLYFFNPDNFFIHYPNYVDAEGLYVYNCLLNDEGFYIHNPNVRTPDWTEISLYTSSYLQTTWTPAYASNLYVLVNGDPVPNNYRTDNFEINWDFEGDFLRITYRALTDQGEVFVPSILIASFNGLNPQYIDISSDFTSRPEPVTSVPYNEIGVLNNFRGAWGNKGGARSMDFAFDALDIHGYNEQQALVLRPIAEELSFDFLLNLVSGSNVFVGDSPPPTAKIGDYYWNNETGAMAVYYQDADRNMFWVEVNYPASPCQVGTPGCDYFPLKPFLSTGGCFLSNGDTWKDPDGLGCTIWYDSPNNVSEWVEFNWNADTRIGWEVSQQPSLIPDYSVLDILITDDFIPVEPNELYTTEDYSFFYTIDEIACTWTFNYTALSPLGVQKQPRIWVGIASNNYPPYEITEYVFSNAQFFLAPAVQNAEWTLRPWKTQSLEVTDELAIIEDTYENGLRADINRGPGDEDWSRSFIRLPSEYGRNSKVWNQSKLVMQDFAYFGSPGNLKGMRCPNFDQKPQIYEQVVFERSNPGVGAVLFSAPYFYSDVEGFNNLLNYFPEQEVSYSGYLDADLDFATDGEYDEWNEANLQEYEALHNRTILTNGDWDGVYLEPTGNRQLTGFVERDLRVKSVIPVPAPVWDASIYKYAPLCPQGPESYEEDPNNYKVTYAYFAADLSASEDGFFDQSQDVSWREPLVEDQTLYILNN